MSSASVDDFFRKRKELEALEAAIARKMKSGELKVIGVLAFTSVDDKFIFVPVEGFPTGPTLAEMTNMDLVKESLNNSERRTNFDLIFSDGGEPYSARVFCRVEEGKKL